VFEDWAEEFLTKIAHPNTQQRYSSSVEKLKLQFAGLPLNEISPERIETYKERRLTHKERRLTQGVEPATVNHDLRVLRRMLHLAERKQLILQNPFTRLEFLKQRPPRPPHIITF
jgi:site-specific recombinase XerD